MENEPRQLLRGDVINLHETYHGGIRKILYWVAGLDTAFITVQDDLGPDFAIDIPKKEDMPEGRNPMWYLDHCMLFGPKIDKRGNLYASPEN